MIKFLYFIELVGILYGIYSEINSIGDFQLPLTYLPKGQGLSITIICAVMTIVNKVVDEMYKRMKENKDSDQRLFSILTKANLCIPVHEREFYSLWSNQVRFAEKNVDITHLGKFPPRNRHGEPESKYFEQFKYICKETSAFVRRVERFTKDKEEWINKLKKEFEGMHNFSLALYSDPSDDEMPTAISVCRIDDRYAWIVAIAEHESTDNFRDILVTGAESVSLIRKYYQNRLWDRSKIIIDHGVIIG